MGRFAVVDRVDFSGARLAGRTTPVARLVIGIGRMHLAAAGVIPR